MELTIDELHSFLSCPAKYKFKKSGLMTEENRSTKFSKAIHKTVDYFFYSVMNEQLPTLANLKDKWAATCKELISDGTEEGVFGVRKGYNPRSKPEDLRRFPEYVKGMEMIHNFYHFNKDNLGVPILVDHEYRVPIGGLIIKGRFELVREIVDPEDGKRYIELVDFKTSDKPLDYFTVKNDINLTIASYAFRNLFKSEEDRVKYHYLNTGRDIAMRKVENDFKRMEAIISGVAAGIKGEHFFPRQTFMCRNCEVQDVCDRTKF